MNIIAMAELVSKSQERKVPRLKLTSEEMTEMNEHQKTDVILSWNFPFMTLTESKISNIWYHEYFDWLCVYTARGFKPTKGSKKYLFERGFGKQ